MPIVFILIAIGALSLLAITLMHSEFDKKRETITKQGNSILIPFLLLPFHIALFFHLFDGLNTGSEIQPFAVILLIASLLYAALKIVQAKGLRLFHTALFTLYTNALVAVSGLVALVQYFNQSWQ